MPSQLSLTDEPKPVVATVALTAREYEAIVDQAPILIWRSDVTGACDYFNERWLRFTGRRVAEELGDGWAAAVHPDDLERCLAIYRRAFEARQKFSMEYRLRRHDGVYRWMTDCGVPLVDEQDRFVGYIGSCIDVTDHVELLQLMQTIKDTELKRLRGLLPICAYCKKIRDDRGYWFQLEHYLAAHSDADFSHGICPECRASQFPEYTHSHDAP